MASHGSISGCIDQLKQGDPEAAHTLWQRYFRRLVGLARKKLGDGPRQIADEEDLALSALDSVFRRTMGGEFSRLVDRDDLWRLLGVITSRKASNLARHEGAQKRRRGAEGPDPDQVVGPGPTPEQAAQFAEECQRRLDRLGDAVLRDVALWKLEDCTNDEIAERLCCDRRTVERKLRLIRAIWEKEPGT